MSLMVWIVLGLFAGFVGSKIVNKRGEGLLRDTFLGVAGAVLGGLVFSAFRAPGGLNLASVLVSVIGAVTLLLLYHAVRRSSA